MVRVAQLHCERSESTSLGRIARTSLRSNFTFASAKTSLFVAQLHLVLPKLHKKNTMNLSAQKRMLIVFFIIYSSTFIPSMIFTISSHSTPVAERIYIIFSSVHLASISPYFSVLNTVRSPTSIVV